MRHRHGQRSSGTVAAMGLALAALFPQAAWADHALVVGVNHYPNLPAEAQLQGPDNDVQTMTQRLTALGFRVTVLTDGQATREGILNALDALKSKNTAGERFAFYFAGHGTLAPDGSGCIVPSDARLNAVAGVIERDELYSAVRSVPACARTVLLDSCFSGAMPRAFDLAKGLHRHLRYRSYDLFGNTKSIVRVNKRGQPIVGDGGGVCYFVACDPHQRSYEDEIDGVCHGLFTYSLAHRLKTLGESWLPVQTDVTGGVMKDSGDSETPTLSAGYEATNVLSSGTATSTQPGRHSLWDQFNTTQDDPGHLVFAMTPDRTTVRIGEQFSLVATPKIDGFLVVLELDTDGSVNLMSPLSRTAGDARVTAGATVPLPTDTLQTYSVNKEGMENVKAILFQSERAAQDLLSAFPASLTVSEAQRDARDLVTVRATGLDTGTLSFEVSGQADSGGR